MQNGNMAVMMIEVQLAMLLRTPLGFIFEFLTYGANIFLFMLDT